MISLFITIIISSKLQAQDLEKNGKSCRITWRKAPQAGRALQFNLLAYFYNGNYAGTNTIGLEKIITNLKNFKGNYVLLEVPFLPKSKSFPLGYPGSRIPLFKNSDKADNFINVLKSFEVEIIFNHGDVHWPKQDDKTLENHYRRYSDTNWPKQKDYMKNKTIKYNNCKEKKNSSLHISWQRLKNNSCIFFYNGKNVGMDKIGFNEILNKIKSFAGSTIDIKFPYVNDKDKPNLTNDFYRIPFFTNSKFTTSDNPNINATYVIDDFIPLIKSKGLTVKLKFPEEKKEKSKTGKE